MTPLWQTRGGKLTTEEDGEEASTFPAPSQKRLKILSVAQLEALHKAASSAHEEWGMPADSGGSSRMLMH